MKEMAIKHEILGLKFELIGLFFAFIAICSQVIATEWWERQLREWQSHIQADVNLTILNSLKNMGSLMIEDNKKNKKDIVERMSKDLDYVYEKTAREGDNRQKEIKEGQPNLFGSFRGLLLIIIAFFFLVGKWFTLRSKSLYKYQEQHYVPEAP